ncbi:recombinase family protein [Gaetbulibacter jejuensis]|uniref:recombinase family protein n=1 Tax=Gaetbulibacter jejuensis TaxID=584607 RepID=UPI0030083C4F
MKNVIIYSRVSTDEQAQQGYSLEYQEETITRYCQIRGYNILASFREDFSAKDFRRPQWKGILSLVKASNKTSNPIDAIVILRVDRFSRNLILSFSETAKLSALGCQVEFVEGQVDETNPEAILIQAISYALPEIENKKISRRTQEGTRKARLNGCYTGRAPIGYKHVRINGDSTLEFNHDAPIVREAFEKMAAGINTADEIRRWMNSKGVKISKSNFPNLIRNITYSGKLLVKKLGEQPQMIVPGMHPAIISEELFSAANDALNGRVRKMDFKSDKTNLYPLKGHLYCKKHQRTLSAYASTGRKGVKYHYYICTKPHVKCDRYPVDVLHEKVEKILSKIQFSAKIVGTYRHVLKRTFESDSTNRKSSIRNLMIEIEKLSKRREFINDEYMDGKLSSEDYQELKNSINSKLFELKNQLDELNKQTSPFNEYVDKQIPMLENLVEYYRSVDGKTKNRILGCIFSEKLVFEDGKVATIKFTKPIQLLLNASKGLEKLENKKEVENDLFLNLVAGTGLEPVTFGL